MNDRPVSISCQVDRPLPLHVSLLAGQAGDHIARDPDARLTQLALAAQAGDVAARNDLYRALTPNIDRMVGACHRLTQGADCPRRDGRPWDREDLAQEAYLIFTDLINAWSGDGSFTPYLFGYFPWRLRNAWRRLRPARGRSVTVLRSGLDLVADESAVADEARILLETLALRLPEIERLIMLAYVRDGMTLAEIGRRLGLRPRQVGRRWRAIKQRLRTEAELRPPAPRIIPFPDQS